MSKGNRIKYVTLALIAFLCIILANLILLFKPLYEQVYYGQAKPLFYYGGSSVLLIIFFIVFKNVIVKKMKVDYNKEKGELPLKNLIVAYSITVGIIFVISGIIGWNVKIFHDLGTNFTGYQLIIHAVKIVYHSMVMMLVIAMIENFQYGLEGLIPVKNENFNEFFPVGGIATMLTYGIYQLVMGLTTLSGLYFVLIVLYGLIYLLVKRSFIKSYFASLLIFLF